uniref:Protein kinase domain-containing protein n=1 Tax=Davidia involucrata TaxID=16924 RepID=A0A5B6Z0G6_DAVIN
MGWCSFFVLLCVSWTFLILGTHQLQSSQTEVLLQLRKHLEYPKQLEIWYNKSIDFCYLSSTQVNITCQDNFVTELRIVGDKKPTKVSHFDGFAIPNQTLSENFSMDSFVATLARLTSLRVLSLQSLGIWGPLPDKIHRLYSLEYLDLSSNFLFGSVPQMSRMMNLQTLALDSNFFNGSIPDWLDSLSNLTNLSLRFNRLSGKLPDLLSLTSLHVLDLSDNKLDSELPSLPKGLVMAFLNNNSFTGEIPRQYSQLGQLQHIDLSFNSLRGKPPAALFSLPNISYLNLASNMLSGSLPIHLSCGSELGLVDISNNRLRGWLPSCMSTELDKRVVKYGWNCLSIDLRHQHPESYCVEAAAHVKRKESGGKSLGILAAVIGGIFVVMVLLAFGFLVLCRRYCPRGISEQHLLHKSVQDDSLTGFSSELLTSARYIAQATKLGTQGVPVHQLFSLEELKEATNNFDISTLLGEGSYGKLYKGRLENGTQVTIRCLTVSKRYTFRNLKLRLDLLAKLRHPHLVCLLGHCIDDGGRDDWNANKVYLIFEYVPNGTYHTHLTENSPEKVLKWSDRLAVLIGVAKAVHFLHTGVIPGFFNNRLKANNILLNEHRMAKLSDYGMSIISEETNKNEEKGEGPKSWQMKCLEDDVYSFGLILLESLVGPSVSARREAFLLNEMVSFGNQDGHRRIVDPIILATSSQESLSIVISIMNKCISPDSLTRPSFEDVLWNLQYAAQVQSTADGDQRSENVSRF